MRIAKLVSKAVILPVFEHDCEDCKFLGRVIGSGLRHDLYVCKNGEYSARFGSVGHQYGSLGEFAPEGSPYALARKLNERKLPARIYRVE